jgi:hypothetical protein
VVRGQAGTTEHPCELGMYLPRGEGRVGEEPIQVNGNQGRAAKDNGSRGSTPLSFPVGSLVSEGVCSFHDPLSSVQRCSVSRWSLSLYGSIWRTVVCDMANRTVVSVQ